MGAPLGSDAYAHPVDGPGGEFDYVEVDGHLPDAYDLAIGGPAQPERIRALFAELLSYPTDEVRQALRLGAAPTGPAGSPDALQRLADATADGLAQLGWIVRRHPWLAEALRWELTGLRPQTVVDWSTRDAVVATAEQMSGRVGSGRYSTDAPDTVDTFIGLGLVDRDAVDEHGGPADWGAVRLLLTTIRPPQPATGAPAAW